MQTRSKTRKAVAENPLVSDSLPDDTLVGIQTRSRKRKAVENTLANLPHHIIIDILLRLPAEYVFRCQRASKLLEILATTPFYIRTHRARHTTSIIALQSFSQSSDREFKFYFTDEQAQKVEEAKLKLDFFYTQKNDPVMLYDSYDGFLLFNNRKFTERSIFVIWNPTTDEQVTITMEGTYFMACGFYFNPHNKEYEVLLLHRDFKGGNAGKYAFHILSFGSKLQRKIILRRNIGRHMYVPRTERPPVIINGILYWMADKIYSDVVPNCSNLIMAFEIGTNKFSTMQHGGASCDDPAGGIYGYKKHNGMHLIEMEGQLGLYLLLDYDAKLLIWVLNPTTNSWVITHTVVLPNHSMPKYFSCEPNSLNVEVVKMKDGKLLIRQMDRLLLCDLDLNTHGMVDKKGFEGDNFQPVIHTHSLVSLNADKFIQLHSGRDHIFVD
ncbi:putative F-box protein At4g21240 [Papaver somniferum]|uniref:putative F-box protein At4g21240 n=1 Tax=Papaver somniferum TaxID=3469 RepID=UPI000E700AA4|nr:putative F-box protein At4g21240 [Papaver somniferum]